MAFRRKKTWLSQFFEAPANDTADTKTAHVPEEHFFDVAEDASVHEKWLTVLAGRKAVDCSVEDLRQLIDLGAPLIQRHALWPRWWRYPNIVDVEELQGRASNESTVQIDLDLRRTLSGTFPDSQRASLRRVLRAYAAYNPNVGYCQGMNFIAAVPLLLAFGEKEAFLGLRYIVEEVCPDYHGVSMGGYFRDAAVLDALVSQLLPEIHREVLDLEIPFDMLITDHLLTLSASKWPLHAVARLWDIILMEGSPALWASFLALLQVYFQRAVAASRSACTQSDEVSSDVAGRFLELARTSILVDIDVVVQHTRKFIPLVRGDLVGKLRAQFSDRCDGTPVKKRASEKENVAAPNGSLEVLIEATITMQDGTRRQLQVGILDQPKAVARRFVEEEKLDKNCVPELAAWLRKAERDAVGYPVRTEAHVDDISRGHKNCN